MTGTTSSVYDDRVARLEEQVSDLADTVARFEEQLYGDDVQRCWGHVSTRFRVEWHEESADVGTEDEGPCGYWRLRSLRVQDAVPVGEEA